MLTQGVLPVRRLISRDLPPCAGALFKGSHLKLRRPPRWLKMASTLPDDTAPSASLDRLEAQAAPTHPRAPPEHLGSLPWPQEPATGRLKVGEFSLSTPRYREQRAARVAVDRVVGRLLVIESGESSTLGRPVAGS